MESTLEYIARKTGKKPNNCKCQLCKSQCHTPGIGTPEDMKKIIDAGFTNKVALTIWDVEVRLGMTNTPTPMITPRFDKTKNACAFFIDGLCELHDLGLKPTECKLSNHEMTKSNWTPKKAIAHFVAKEWQKSSELINQIKHLYGNSTII